MDESIHHQSCADATASQPAETPGEALIEESTLENWRSPLHSLTRATSAASQSSPRCVVALGKFDAMHLGHRSLVERAASMGGEPWLISFDGMAAELGAHLMLEMTELTRYEYLNVRLLLKLKSLPERIHASSLHMLLGAVATTYGCPTTVREG